MAFEINYLIGDIDTYFRQDEMSVLFYYAKDIDLDLTKKMNYLLDKKVSYMMHNNINVSELDSNDEMDSYFNSTDIKLVIQFIMTQLVPSMQKENIDLVTKDDESVSKFINKINNYNSTDSGFLLNINHDYVPTEVAYYIDMANEMKNLLQTSLDLNKPILVSYND